MNPGKTLIAAALSLTASLAQAQANLSYGASVAGPAAAEYPYISESRTEAPYTSGGPVVATSGGLRAEVAVVADPTVGSFKSFTSAVVSDGGSGSYADAYARLDLYDTLNFSGPGSTVELRFTLSWDTRVSGVGSVQAPALVGPFGAFLQTSSQSTLTLSYEVPNPAYDPDCVDMGEVACPGPTTTIYGGGQNIVFTEANIGRGDGLSLIGMNGEASGDGHFTGQQLITMVVPTGQDISLSYFAFNSSRCFQVLACSVTTDASHSDYLGLSLADGYSFTSANGFQYLGVTAAVPEPGSWLLGLMGVGLAVAGRRRAAQRPGPSAPQA